MEAFGHLMQRVDSLDSNRGKNCIIIRFRQLVGARLRLMCPGVPPSLPSLSFIPQTYRVLNT